LDESDLSLPGFGTGMTVDVRQLSGKLPEYQMSLRATKAFAEPHWASV